MIRKKKKHENYLPNLKASDPQVMELWVRAGGRCEFHGCNDYLLQDKLTTTKAILADVAHIVARSKSGPRGDDSMLLIQRNEIENLFLACTKHHRMIDKKSLVTRYPKELLLKYKEDHEERTKYLTGLGDENETTVIRMIGNVRGNSVSISNEEIRVAALKSSGRYPRYLGAENHIEIDLTSLPDNDLIQYWKLGAEKIQDSIKRMVTPVIERGEIRHLSLFAFARIPFLAYLGHSIGDKIPLDIFQKHRSDREGWIWSSQEKDQKFKFKKIQVGRNNKSIAIIVSISGKVPIEHLPPLISKDFTIYSLVPVGSKPSRNLMSSKGTLNQFRHTYARLLREIEGNYPFAKIIHVLPALPISGALILGRELLRDVSPSLVIYDKSQKGFEEAIKINTNEKG